jgi:trimeric autotransporter adhesin
MRSLVVLIVILAACGDNRGGGPDASPNPPDGAPPDAAMPGDPTQGAWLDLFGLPGPSGFGSRVEDVAIATDGSVYAAGIFQDAAGVPAANIARWTGTDWAPLGPGLDGWVRAIAFDAGGTLWAATTADDVSSASLARWDGTAWTVANTLDGAIRDLAITTGGIAVVGDFTGGVRVLDTTDDSWIDVAPAGVGNGAPSAIAATTAGFCLAGSFDAIDGVAAENAACFDGTDWTALGTGLPGGVATLVRSPGGAWFAGGTLTFIVDPTTGEYEAGIGHLVGGAGGTWQPFQGGIDNGFINEVRAIAFDGTDVLVGGHFQTAGTTDVQASHLARFTPGTGWSEISGGLANDVGVFLPSIIGTGDIEVATDGTLWVGGLFTRAGGAPAVNMAMFPASGSPTALVGPHAVLGVGGFIDTIAHAPGCGGVLAGGLFAFGGLTPIANLGTLAVGALDVPPWAELGGLPNSIVRDSLVLSGCHVAIAGELFIDGAPAAYAEWDGAAWTLPGGRVEGAGFALVQDAGGTVWLGGDLWTANGAPIANLARLEHGVWAGDGTFDGRVGSLALQGDTVIAGGSFTMVDGAPAAAIAVRDARGTWTELGGGIDGDFSYVNAVAVSPSLGVIVGGEFPGIGGTTAHDLAAWNGTTWSALSTGLTENDFSFVSAILPYGDGVFVSGGFNAIGGGPVSNVAWFDGTAWHPLGAGLADLAEEMVVITDVLWIGGPFTAAGGRPASGIAAWDFQR